MGASSAGGQRPYRRFASQESTPRTPPHQTGAFIKNWFDDGRLQISAPQRRSVSQAAS